MTTVTETMTRQATVAEASQVAGRNGETQWALKLEIKDISQFPTPCFLALDRAASILKGSTHIVTMRRGKMKTAKTGNWASDYFWDVTDWDVKAPPPQPPAAQAPSATERPQEAAPAAPVPWDAADTQSCISWAQAVNLAVEAIGVQDFRGNEVMRQDPLVYFADVEVLANRFYPLIRKGPTAQEGRIDPETLPWDAPQRPQEATGVASEPTGVSKATLPNFPIRGEREAAVNYFLRVAKERYGLKTQKDALAVIGGTWSGWVDKSGGDGEEALHTGLQKLQETP